MKSTKCLTCRHPEINKINEQMVSGVPSREVARQHDLNHMSVSRHRDKHLPEILVKAQALQERETADQLLDRVESVYDKAWDLVSKAEAKGSFQPAVNALKEARNCLELIGKLLGEIKTGNTYTLIYNPEFIQVRHVITEALQPYPEARQAVVKALEGDVIDVEHRQVD